MAETAPGGRYETKNGRIVDAHGKLLGKAPTPAAAPNDLTTLANIGPATAEKLKAAGFGSFSALAEAEVADIEAVTSASAEQVLIWQEAARA